MPNDLEEELEDLTPEQLDDIARLAERLAEDKRRKKRIEQQKDFVMDLHGDEMPDGVPTKATLTKKKLTGTNIFITNGGMAILSKVSIGAL
ncbi:hypothetical protein [Halopelagius fulvigenes]|uniref:Transposase n=1 Tax=Halopelagius fulvigenes TaxID=1198324 RepID=A0ABD5TX77_9EURY